MPIRMTGVAGKGRGLENAQALADFYNRTRPERDYQFSMFIHREAPLCTKIYWRAGLPRQTSWKI